MNDNALCVVIVMNEFFDVVFVILDIV